MKNRREAALGDQNMSDIRLAKLHGKGILDG